MDEFTKAYLKRKAELEAGGAKAPTRPSATPYGEGAALVKGTRAARSAAVPTRAGAWSSDRVGTGAEREKPVMMLPTAPKTTPVPGYERERAALGTGVSLPMARMRQADTVKRELDGAQMGTHENGGQAQDFATLGVRSRPDYADMVEEGRSHKETGFRFGIPDNGILDAFMGGISAKGALQYLNDPEYAMSERMREQSGPIPENRFSKLDYLTDEERETIYYHAGREEWSDINKYLDDLDTELNRRDQEKVSQQTAEQTAKHPVLGTGLNIASSLLSPLSYVDAAGQTIKNAITGEEKPLDTNTPLYRFANTTRDTQEALTEKARDAAGGEGLGADIAGFAAGTGLSIGQNVARLPMGAVAGLVDMAMGAAAGQSIDVTERGANSGTAMLESTAVGAVEYLTEKLPFERLFRLAKNSPVSAGEVVRNILGQVFLEGGEEVVSEVAGNLIDRAIMGDSSSYELYAKSLVEQGLSEEEAREEATRQFYVENVAAAFAGGAVSGGVMGGAAQAVGALNGRGDVGAPKAPGETHQTSVYTGPSPSVGEPRATGDVFGQQKPASMGETVQDYQRDEHHGEILDTVRANLKSVAEIQPVASLTGREFQKTEGDTRNMRKKVIDFFSSIGNKVTRADMGEIELNTSGARDSLAHGYGRLKAVTFAALPNVLEQGKIISHKGPYEGHNYDSYVISAPVSVDGETVYVGALIIKDRTQRYKLHEVLTTNENGVSLFKSETTSQGADGPLRNDTPPGEPEGSPTDTILAPGESGVKIEDMQKGGEYAGKPEHMTDEEWNMWQAAKVRNGYNDGAYKGTPATDKLGIRVKKPIAELGAAASLRGTEKARYEAGRALDRVLKETRATPAERLFAEGVAEGTYSMGQLPPGMNPKTMEEIVQAVKVHKSYNAKAIATQKGRVNWAFDAKVQELIKQSDEKKSPGTLSLNANTMQRNNERTWGEDAAAINAEMFDPVTENEAERIRFVNRTLGKMETYKLTEAESGMVQRLMEKRVTEGELRAQGADVERLTRAAKTLSEIYGDFYEAINDFLVAHGYKEIGFQKNYAPHMQEEQVDTLQKYLHRLGFQTQVNELPTDLAGRTDGFKPGKQYDPYFQHRKGGKTIDDAVGGLESYVNYLSDVFYHTDDIQKLRRFSEALRTKYGSEELASELDRLNSLEDRLATDDDSVVGRESIEDVKMAAFERYGNMSRFGPYVSVLDDYTNVLAGKQTKLDRAVESLLGRKALNWGRNIQNAFSRAAILGNLSSAINQTVQLPQLVAEVGTKYAAQAVGDVVMGKTGKSGFTQESDFLTGKRGIQSIAEKNGIEQFFDLAAKPFEVVDDFASRIIVRSKYLEQVASGKRHTDALKTADAFATRMVGSRMKGSKPVLFEQKNPFSKLVTTFQLEVANGWQHIVHDLPMEIQTLAKTKGKGAAVKRTAELLVASQIAAFVANALIKSITGREPVPFDGLGMLANYLASGYGMTKEEYMAATVDGVAETVTGERPLGTERAGGVFSTSKALKTGLEDVLDDVPYVSNITAMLGLSDGRLPLPQVWNSQLGKGAKKIEEGVTAETQEERQMAMEQGLASTAEGLLSAAATWLPIGSQVKKSLQGGQALARGGVYSGYGDQERLQYGVEQTPANIARGLLFGRSALPEANKYYAGGMPLMSAKQTQTYQDLIAKGMSHTEAYKVIQDVRGAEKPEDGTLVSAQLKALEGSGVTGDVAASVYGAMLATASEKNLMERMGKSGVDMEPVYRVLAGIRTAKNSAEKRVALVAADGLSDAQKSDIGVSVIGDSRKMDYSSETTLELSMMDEWARDKAVSAKRSGIEDEVFLAAYRAQNGVRGDKDRDGNTIALSASRKKKAAIDAAVGELERESREVLYEMFSVSSKVWGEESASVVPVQEKRKIEQAGILGKGLMTYKQWAGK